MPLDSFISPFVGFDTVTKTLSSGHTLELKADLPAGDGYRLFRLMRQLADTQDPEHMKAITLLFLDTWSLEMSAGTPAPITADALDNLTFRLRAEVDAVVEAHVAEWVAKTTGILGDAGQAKDGESPLADGTTGGSPSSAPRKRSTKPRTK